jgi:RNA polymerase sigma-B factor
MTTLSSPPSPSAARSGDDYGDVAAMFARLAVLEVGSAPHLRQRDAIIERCLPLAENVARRFRGRGEHHDDLVQVARVGLLNAVNRYDVESGYEFLAYAVPTMMGEIRRHFRDHGWSLKVPRRLKDLNVRLGAARAELTQQLNRAPTPSELAVHLGMDREEVVEGLIAANAYATRSSEQTTVVDGDGFTVLETVGADDANLDKVLDVHTVQPLIARLPERDRLVLKLRFFDSKTQTQIAEEIGVSQMHVSRLLTRALSTLRAQIA